MRALFAFLMLTLALSVHATDYCVSTVAQFKQALRDAETDGVQSTIKLRQGVYVLDESLRYGPLGGPPQGGLIVRGGFIGADCLIAQSTPVGTTIAGTTALSLFVFDNDALKVEYLTFVALDVEFRACVFGSSNPCEMVINRIRGQSNQTTIDHYGGSGIIRDSLFTIGRDGLALTIEVPDFGEFDNSGDIRVINVSVINALTRIVGRDNDGGPEGRRVDIRNSSFSRSGETEIDTDRDIELRFSRYDTLQSTNGATVIAGSNTAQQPNFNAQFIPNPGSPLIDRGTASVVGGLTRDVYNEPRVIGQSVDIGAAESPVDGSGIFVVDTTAASGAGSLAAAIAFANADDAANLIRFNIPGSCPKRLTRSSALAITDGLTIDGYSQPGSVLNTGSTLFNAQPCIILSGTNRTHDGLVAGSALTAKQEGMRIRGIAFENFATAIELDHGLNHIIIGNQFGGTFGNTAGADTVLEGNDVAIAIEGSGERFATIGGADADDKNLLVGADQFALRIASDNNTVINNQIGYDNVGSGSSGFNNAVGILITGANNLINDNKIGNHGTDGVRLSGAGARDNRIQANQFGRPPGGRVPPNNRWGVYLFSDANRNVIGPDNDFVGNLVGIRMTASAGGRNRIDRNSMLDQIGLGIDLGTSGVTANDIDPSLCDLNLGCASNAEQNYPSVTRAQFAVGPLGRPLLVNGSLRSVVRSQPYRLAFFVSNQCNASGFGEGAIQIDTTELTIVNAGFCQASNCTAGFSSFIAAADVEPNDYLTVTATSPSGDTSEFSACQRILARDLIFTDGFD